MKTSRYPFPYFFVILVLFITGNMHAKNLKVLDDFSGNSRTEYVTNYTDGTYDLPETNWRISSQKLYPFPVDREQQWNNNPSTKRGANLYRKADRLKPGEAISITIQFTNLHWKYPKLGLVVENTTFTITPGNAGYFLGLAGKEYNLDATISVNREMDLTLVRGTKQNSNTIYWQVKGSEIARRGEYVFEHLPEEAHFGLSFYASYSEQQRDLCLANFRKGKMPSSALEDTPLAELTMNSKLPPIYSNPSKLVLDDKQGGLSKNEVESLVQWALNEPAQWSNHGNRALFKHVDLYKVYKVYAFTKDKRILNHLVNIGNTALESRNDRNKVIGSYKTLTGYEDGKWTYDIGPIWPHFMGWNEQGGERYYHGDAGEDAVGVHYMALAARAIAETPEVWNESIKGSDKTYRKMAELFIEEAIVTVENSIIPKYIEPETYESVYQYRRSLPGKSVLDLGGFVPFNRFWHVPVAFVSLCPAMELLEVQTEKVATYDKISNVSIQRWIKSMEHTTKDGMEMIDYPYCYPSEKEYHNNPKKWDFMPTKFKGFPSEDLNHMGCDASQLYIFHFSPRYEVPADILRKWANALVINTPQEDSDYLSYRLNGTGRGKMKCIATDAYFLSLFQPKMEAYFWDNPHANKTELERQVLFLKLMKK